MAAAKAEYLRQRAAKLQDAGDLTRRLKEIAEAAKRPLTAREDAAKGKRPCQRIERPGGRSEDQRGQSEGRAKAGHGPGQCRGRSC